MSKPTSGSPLDTSGAFYSGLNNWYGMLEGSGGTTADGKGANTGTLDASVTWTTDADGPLLAFAGGAIFPITISSVVLSATGATDWSVAWRGKLTTDNLHGTVVGTPNYAFGGGRANGIVMSGGSDLQWDGYGTAQELGANFTGVTSFTTQRDYVLATDFALGKLHLYVNGVEDSSSPDTTGDGFEITAIGNGLSIVLAELIGTLSYVGVWIGRALTGAEAATLHTDPYGALYSSRLFLIP